MHKVDLTTMPEGATHYDPTESSNYWIKSDESGFLFYIDLAKEWCELSQGYAEKHSHKFIPISELMTDKSRSVSDGSTASYYELPSNATELQQLISHKNMNAQIGEIFRSCYRYGEVSHSDMLRDAKKIKFYADAEIKRLEAKK